MPAELVNQPAGAGAPDASGSIAAARDEELPVGAEGNGVETRALSENVQASPALGVPDPRPPVGARSRDEPAVGTEGAGRDRPVVPKDAERPAPPRPDSCRMAATRCEDSRTVGAERG